MNKLIGIFGCLSTLSIAIPAAYGATVLTGDARLTQSVPGNGDQLRTGESTGGTVRIDGGTSVTLDRGSDPDISGDAAPGAIIGRRAGDVNTMDIDDAELIINADGASGFLQIARDGVDAEVSLTNGARIEIRDDTAASGTGSFAGEGLFVGRSGSGTGTLNVTDSEILITSTSGAFMWAGREGADGVVVLDNSSLTLEDRDPNAAANSSATFTLGRDVGSDGDVLITNGSTVTISSDTGSANILVSRAFGATGNLVLDMGSIIDLSTSGPVGSFGADLQIGSAGTGQVTVTGGSKILFTSSDGDVFVGAPAGGTPFAGSGTLNITGSGSEVAATDIVVVGRADFYDPSNTSAGGLIDVSAGGILSTLDGMHVGENGEIKTDADVRIGTGAVSVPGSANVLAENYIVVSDGGTLTADTIHLDSGGFLGGNAGIIDADVMLSGGVLGPGASPGSMDILGDLTYSGGFIDLEIGGTGPGQFDVLNIFGSLILPASPLSDLLRITFLDSYLAAAGDTFNVLNFDALSGGPITASFFNEDGDALEGYGIDFSSSTGSFGFSVVSVPDPLQPVPLPASLPILLAGLGSLAMLKNRRSQKTDSGKSA